EGPRSNVVARYRGKRGKPVLHISAHIDTAAIQEEGWTVDPLGGEVTKDTPYMKSDYDRG
ncbi:MAG: succinyl-diaminopimelate desuccinylase, partial [Thermoplasmata archaeon]|nr:succinyl-diaminopimelate desuccinylase [Thermoplasmata archaeon]NIS14150.1 succinyl-diaminopimelate desuccinylase [Thermoplasmata archaeon]NIT79848.1 succinyl-diaminopimelate desuccinylase [Thermoplasmata archaeon]NIV80716.1 succinyl-diaminopimelate desuccinylase [Thermoplasmata archaeon]NIW88451.1 succinyl-diaminopimelate desuccinylase [Thermoplasmata archaeon]